MPNMQMNKTPMPTREAEKRNKDFEEVTLGYTEEMALNEAQRCLNCRNMPCKDGCPVGISIPVFIKALREGDKEGAYAVLSSSTSLPAVCGRVCPQEKQCEAKCVRGLKGEPVAIGRLERYVADVHNAQNTKAPESPQPNGHRVAVVGSGPAGLSCAGDLARKGYAVHIFEALHLAGGVLSYGIPEFRLPKSIVNREVAELEKLGVKIETNAVIGRTLTVDDLFEQGFEAVFLGSGAGLPKFMGIPGEELKGVYSANEFLTRNNLMKAYLDSSDTPAVCGKRVAVVGGGNVAMDAARTALRLGAESVRVVYRRSMEELPARREEVEHAIEEGVEFCLLQNPVEILGYDTSDRKDPHFGWVRALRCIEMQLGEPDEKGRRRPEPVPGSEFEREVDTVILALGTSPNPLLKNTTKGLETDRHGCLVVREGSTETTRKRVYAGGDAVTGAATVILAMGAGKEAAFEIHRLLSGEAGQ